MIDSDRKKPWHSVGGNIVLWGLVLGIILFLCC